MFKFQPSRRVFIPKKNSKSFRPLTIASPRDKIVHEAMKTLLEPIFENKFSDYSHGFRPNKSSATALNQVRIKFGAVNWFIEGDITNCFDEIPHNIIISRVESVVEDQAFIDLL